jgi:hypothetical protein
MRDLGTALILGGMALAAIAQVVGAIKILNVNVAMGVLSLIVPGYFLFALRRHGIYRQVVGAWLIGILGLAIGTIIVS